MKKLKIEQRDRILCVFGDSLPAAAFFSRRSMLVYDWDVDLEEWGGCSRRRFPVLLEGRVPKNDAEYPDCPVRLVATRRGRFHDYAIAVFGADARCSERPAWHLINAASQYTWDGLDCPVDRHGWSRLRDQYVQMVCGNSRSSTPH